jgi:hypothetical protein
MQVVTDCTGKHIDNQYREFFKFGVMPFWNNARKRLELHKRPMGIAKGLPPITRTKLKKAGGKYYGAGEEQVWWEIYHSQQWKPSTPKEPMETTSWWSYFYGDDEAQQDMQPRQYWEWTRWERAGRQTAKALECFDENWRPLDDVALKRDAVKGFKKINGRWIEDPERIDARARLYAKAEYAEAMHLCGSTHNAHGHCGPLHALPGSRKRVQKDEGRQRAASTRNTHGDHRHAHTGVVPAERRVGDGIEHT